MLLHQVRPPKCHQVWSRTNTSSKSHKNAQKSIFLLHDGGMFLSKPILLIRIHVARVVDMIFHFSNCTSKKFIQLSSLFWHLNSLRVEDDDTSFMKSTIDSQNDAAFFATSAFFVPIGRSEPPTTLALLLKLRSYACCLDPRPWPAATARLTLTFLASFNVCPIIHQIETQVLVASFVQH